MVERQAAGAGRNGSHRGISPLREHGHDLAKELIAVGRGRDVGNGRRRPAGLVADDPADKRRAGSARVFSVLRLRCAFAERAQASSSQNAATRFSIDSTRDLLHKRTVVTAQQSRSLAWIIISREQHEAFRPLPPDVTLPDAAVDSGPYWCLNTSNKVLAPDSETLTGLVEGVPDHYVALCSPVVAGQHLHYAVAPFLVSHFGKGTIRSHMQIRGLVKPAIALPSRTFGGCRRFPGRDCFEGLAFGNRPIQTA